MKTFSLILSLTGMFFSISACASSHVVELEPGTAQTAGNFTFVCKSDPAVQVVPACHLRHSGGFYQVFIQTGLDSSNRPVLTAVSETTSAEIRATTMLSNLRANRVCR